MRISTSTNDDTTGFLKVGSDTNVQVLDLCSLIQIGGIAHNSRSEKSAVSGILRVNKPIINLKLEITVVTDNEGSESEWFESDFVLIAMSPTPTTCFPGQSKVSVKDN
jgi:hypothetical protein